MRVITIFIFFILLSFVSKAQFDSNYVHITKNRFAVSPVFELYKTSYRIKEFAPELEGLIDTVDKKFSSKNNLYLGFGLTFYRIGIALSFNLPHSNIPELEKTTSISFLGGYSYKKFYGEFRYRNYQGLEEQTYTYLEDSVIEEFNVRQDSRFEQIGGILYFFSSRKYNYDANFKNYNIQKKSAFSPLATIGVNYFKLKGKFTTADSLHPVEIGRTVRVFSYKIAAGVAGSLVYKKVYASAVTNIGIALNDNELSSSDNLVNNINILPSFEYKMAVGYNSNQFFAALTFIYDNDVVYFYPNKIGINNYYFGIKVGYKFNSKYLGKAARFL